jgi:UDP-N-acetylglucosamine transferase subunit ALG13
LPCRPIEVWPFCFFGHPSLLHNLGIPVRKGIIAEAGHVPILKEILNKDRMPISYKEFVRALKIVRKYQEQIKKHHVEVSEKLDSISVYATVSRDTDIKNSKLAQWKGSCH